MDSSPVTAQGSGKRKIAILGGGCGGLAAAWGLVNSAQAESLEITVYQIGWRLGGKGASGRNTAINDRIEEHGLHIWGGMYENAFAMMRGVYEACHRPRGTPLSTWYDPTRPEDSAFLPHDRTTLGEFYNGSWVPWTLDLPSNSDLPGDGQLLPSGQEYLDLLMSLIEEVLFGSPQAWHAQSAPPQPRSSILASLGDVAGDVLDQVTRGLMRIGFRWLARPHLRRARASLRELPTDPALLLGAEHVAVTEALGRFEAEVSRWFQPWLSHHPGIRRLYMICNLGVSVVRGVLNDGLLSAGIDTIDGEEFRDWLQRHGASEITLNGVLVRGWHDFFFAYVNGDGVRPSLSAASGLRTLFRYCFTYRGAFFWKMQAGMGDTVFAPIYTALKAKGVQFKFFHRVQGLHLDEAGTAIRRISVTRQVDLSPGVAEYQPLIPVKSVPSWPSLPDYNQLNPEQARLLQANKINLESWWADWDGVETFDLIRGRDFEDVIFAMPPSAAKHLTGELAERSPEWRSMIDRLATNQTVAAQLWFDQPLEALGWSEGSTVGTVYANPLNTWANMDQLLKQESWQGTPKEPKCVIYFCGTTTDAEPIAPFCDHDFPVRQDARVKEMVQVWLDSNLGPLYPAACLPGTPQLDWSHLVPASGSEGEGRFDSQYWRINIDPSERYVLSLPNTVNDRPRAEAYTPVFQNLWLAGDWLRTGINAGCVEAAVMGGLQASKAMVQWPETIVGDDFDLKLKAPGAP
jgi:uncharacterized protein with NAD-binding domain and iron-sulfur cluster